MVAASTPSYELSFPPLPRFPYTTCGQATKAASCLQKWGMLPQTVHIFQLFKSSCVLDLPSAEIGSKREGWDLVSLYLSTAAKGTLSLNCKTRYKNDPRSTLTATVSHVSTATYGTLRSQRRVMLGPSFLRISHICTLLASMRLETVEISPASHCSSH